MKICSRQVVQANECYNHSARSGGKIWISFQFSLTWRYIACSYENRLIEAILMSIHTIYHFQYEKSTLNYHRSAAMGFFQRIQEWVRNSHGKRAISVRSSHWRSTVLATLLIAWLIQGLDNSVNAVWNSRSTNYGITVLNHPYQCRPCPYSKIFHAKVGFFWQGWYKVK